MRCEICRKWFWGGDRLERHMKDKHPDREVYPWPTPTPERDESNLTDNVYYLNHPIITRDEIPTPLPEVEIDDNKRGGEFSGAGASSDFESSSSDSSSYDSSGGDYGGDSCGDSCSGGGE